MSDWKSKLDRENAALEDAKNASLERIKNQVRCRCGFRSQNGKFLSGTSFTGIDLLATQRLVKTVRVGGHGEYSYDSFNYYQADDLEVCSDCAGSYCEDHIHKYDGKYLCQWCTERMFKQREVKNPIVRWLMKVFDWPT